MRGSQFAVMREGFVVRVLCAGSVVPAGVRFVVGERHVFGSADQADQMYVNMSSIAYVIQVVSIKPL